MRPGEPTGQEHLAARRLAFAKVFQIFTGRWRTSFQRDRLELLLPIWMAGCERVETAQLEHLAVRFAGTFTGKYPPTPGEFAHFARETIQRHTLETGDPDAPPEPTKDLARIDWLGYRAHKRLGTWQLVAEVWALLWDSAPHDDLRAAARNGHVPTDVFDEMIDLVSQGRRAKSPQRMRMPRTVVA
jgi:hypothetical protein